MKKRMEKIVWSGEWRVLDLNKQKCSFLAE
jgi:hypothetical protein